MWQPGGPWYTGEHGRFDTFAGVFAAQFLAVCVVVVSRATLHALAVRLPPELRVLRAVPPTEDTVTTTLWKSQNGSCAAVTAPSGASVNSCYKPLGGCRD